MFHPIYTDANHKTNQIEDPLNLARCLRLYPHDDNQGGFFVAVLERVQDDGCKYQGDDAQDPWLNTKIRQKPILDELDEFSQWYEEQYKNHCEQNNIPEEERKHLGMTEMVKEAKIKEK